MDDPDTLFWWGLVIFFVLAICFVSFLAYKEHTTGYKIIRLEDQTVKVHETVTIDVDGFDSLVVGPEDCPAYSHNKKIVVIPEKPGIYTVVISKRSWGYYIDTYVVRVIVLRQPGPELDKVLD